MAMDLRTAIEKRQTLRRYAAQALSTDELSFLLWCSQGVKQVTTRPATLRTVPSAGARHAFETYVLVNRVDGLNPGLYRYIALQHSLLEIEKSPQITDEITHACFDQEMIRNSAVTFIWVAVVERMAWRYGERGYRYLHLDAGHVCQNLYLAAENLECGVCAIAAFDDDRLNGVLNLDGDEMFAIYLGSVGKRP
jgi:SagB-type dehydrogenase family enzyme